MNLNPFHKSPKEISQYLKLTIYSLILQYALGMYLAMFGHEEAAGRNLFEYIIFTAHVLVGVGLLVGGVKIFLIAKKSGNKLWRSLGHYGLASIGLALIGGILVVLLSDDAAELSSLLMAFSFLAAFGVYGYFWFLVKH